MLIILEVLCHDLIKMDHIKLNMELFHLASFKFHIDHTFFMLKPNDIMFTVQHNLYSKFLILQINSLEIHLLLFICKF